MLRLHILVWPSHLILVGCSYFFCRVSAFASLCKKLYKGIKFVALKSIQTKLAGSGFRFTASVCMASFVNPEEGLGKEVDLKKCAGKNQMQMRT